MRLDPRSRPVHVPVPLQNSREPATKGLVRSPSKAFSHKFNCKVKPFWDKGQSHLFKGAEGTTIHYRTFHHPNERGQLLILHGFGEDILKYRELSYDFYEMGFSLVLMDHRDHGLSGRIGKNPEQVHVDCFQNYIHDVEEVISQSGINRGNLMVFGHSMGGGITLELLTRHPDLFKGAILSSPMVEINTRFMPKKLLLFLVNCLVKLGFGETYCLGQGKPELNKNITDGDETNKFRLIHYYKSLEKEEANYTAKGGPSYQFLREVLAATEGFLDPDFLSKIKIPMILFRTDPDRWVRANEQDQLAELKQARIYVAKGSSHPIFMENSETRNPYMDKIKDFVDKVLPQSTGLKSFMKFNRNMLTSIFGVGTGPAK